MTLKDLKSFLIHNMEGERSKSIAVNREILDHVFPVFSICKAAGKKVTAYQIDETMIFVSDSGLTRPRQVVFIDLMSGTSFLQEIES